MADSTSLVTKTLVEHALDASPSNALGYGLLVAILIIAVSALWWDRNRTIRQYQNRIDDLQDQITRQANKHLGYVKQLRDAIDQERKNRG